MASKGLYILMSLKRIPQESSFRREEESLTTKCEYLDTAIHSSSRQKSFLLTEPYKNILRSNFQRREMFFF